MKCEKRSRGEKGDGAQANEEENTTNRQTERGEALRVISRARRHKTIRSVIYALPSYELI